MTTVATALADRSDVPVWGLRGWALFALAVLLVAVAIHIWETRAEHRQQPAGEPPRLPNCSGDKNRCPGVGSITVLAPGMAGLTIRRVCSTHYLEGLILGYWPGRTNEPFDQEAATLAAEAEDYLRTRQGHAS